MFRSCSITDVQFVTSSTTYLLGPLTKFNTFAEKQPKKKSIGFKLNYVPRFNRYSKQVLLGVL